MRNIDNAMIVAASALLLIVNWLAFHDVREAHTVRDWLMLLATILAIVQFARLFGNGTRRE